MLHKKVHHLISTHVIDLLRMDIMGPMHVEILRRKRHVFVYVDDYSRYIRIEFIREKYDTFAIFKLFCHCLQHEKGEEIGNIVHI